MGNICKKNKRGDPHKKYGEQSNHNENRSNYKLKNEKSNSDQSKHSLVQNSDNKADDGNTSIVRHITEFYPEDSSTVPADNPRISPLFVDKANGNSAHNNKKKFNESGSFDTSEMNLHTSKKYNSCSTIFIDNSTVSQPNLKSEIKLVAFAIHCHIKNRAGDRNMDIFDEKTHPLTNEPVPENYDKSVPHHRYIYKFMKNIFTAAQLTAECAVVTLIYLERVLQYAEIDMCPKNWKRLLLGAILLSSKVWDDQAVWNVDYCQILKNIKVEDMNELERQYLVLLQFNINVPSSVYAKYYFDLRSLAENNEVKIAHELLTIERALKLEAMASLCQDKFKERLQLQKKVRRTASADNLYSQSRKSLVVLS